MNLLSPVCDGYLFPYAMKHLDHVFTLIMLALLGHMHGLCPVLAHVLVGLQYPFCVCAYINTCKHSVVFHVGMLRPYKLTSMIFNDLV